MTQTKTVTTTPFSGAVPSGPDAVATTSHRPDDVDNVCYPTPQTLHGATAGRHRRLQRLAVHRAVTVLPGGSENSLADVAQYYYRTDLRPLMTNDPTKGGVPPAGAGPEDDKASHQHMTTFSIALGVSGTLNYQSDYRDPATVTGDFATIRTGAKNWPLWPDPTLDYSNPDNYNNPKSIDDFWHAAVDGRGRYFNGQQSFVGHPGRRRGPRQDRRQAGDGNGRRNLDPAACGGQQLHLLDELLLGLVAR